MLSAIHFIFVAVLVLFVHVQVSANSSIQFWEQIDRLGRSVVCPFEYYKCYRIDMREYGKASSYNFYNADLLKGDFSITLYTGSDCFGHILTWSGSVGWTRSEYFTTLGDFNGRVQSFKVLDYQTSSKTGHWDHPDASVFNTCHRA